MSLGFVPHNKQTEILGSKPEPEDNFMLPKRKRNEKNLFSSFPIHSFLFSFFGIVEKVNRTVKKVKSLTT